jgi:hypothetical protein
MGEHSSEDLFSDRQRLGPEVRFQMVFSSHSYGLDPLVPGDNMVVSRSWGGLFTSWRFQGGNTTTSSAKHVNDRMQNSLLFLSAADQFVPR